MAQPTQRITASCAVPGAHQPGDDNPRDPEQFDEIEVRSDPDDVSAVRVCIESRWVRVSARLLKLAVDHASETAPKW